MLSSFGNLGFEVFIYLLIYLFIYFLSGKYAAMQYEKIETFIKEDTTRKHHAQDNAASVPFKEATVGPHTALPACLPLFKTLYKLFCWKHHQELWNKCLPQHVSSQYPASKSQTH